MNDAKSVEIVKLLSDHYEFEISEVWVQNASAKSALERGLNVERQSLYQLQLAILEQKTSLDIKKRFGQQSSHLQKREVKILELKQMTDLN